MHLQNIQQIVDEISPLIVGRYLGKVYQMGRAAFAIDFGLRDGRFLFISVEPTAPRLYLIKRRIKDLEKRAMPHTQFAQVLSARLNGALLTDVTRDETERIIRFTLEAHESGDTYILLAQLTGRSANLFLLGPDGRINVESRTSKAEGQAPGDEYHSPAPQVTKGVEAVVLAQGNASLSAALDTHYQKLETEQSFEAVANKVRSNLKKEIQQRTKLRINLEQDLAHHGDPELHKRLGDLLLANLSTAKRTGSKLVIQDFYAEGSPEIELELDKDKSLQEEAAQYFTRYTKAKRAREEIAKRLKQISSDLEALSLKQSRVEEFIARHDGEALTSLLKPAAPSQRGGPKPRSKIPGVRAYRSSDGYEVLVGRAAKDNDYLTFRVAGPNDLWLHSADYPGSHVVVRRQNRKELPQRTIIEAAQLAAHFSQASKDSRVVVHYTPRKFLSKPKGAAPGLVRMSTFKTILVKPKKILERE
ncbi:MAG TPA: NFACT family protein [Pyrinomonadaceae bacterium]